MQNLACAQMVSLTVPPSHLAARQTPSAPRLPSSCGGVSYRSTSATTCFRPVLCGLTDSPPATTARHAPAQSRQTAAARRTLAGRGRTGRRSTGGPGLELKFGRWSVTAKLGCVTSARGRGCSQSRVPGLAGHQPAHTFQSKNAEEKFANFTYQRDFVFHSETLRDDLKPPQSLLLMSSENAKHSPQFR